MERILKTVGSIFESAMNSYIGMYATKENNHACCNEIAKRIFDEYPKIKPIIKMEVIDIEGSSRRNIYAGIKITDLRNNEEISIYELPGIIYDEYNPKEVEVLDNERKTLLR